jgi:hypothetical protein
VVVAVISSGHGGVAERMAMLLLLESMSENRFGRNLRI